MARAFPITREDICADCGAALPIGHMAVMYGGRVYGRANAETGQPACHVDARTPDQVKVQRAKSAASRKARKTAKDAAKTAAGGATPAAQPDALAATLAALPPALAAAVKLALAPATPPKPAKSPRKSCAEEDCHTWVKKDATHCAKHVPANPVVATPPAGAALDLAALAKLLTAAAS